MGNGYAGLEPHVMLGPITTSADITKMVADQKSAEKSGKARELNAFEIAQLTDLQNLAARHGVKLILLAPPTAAGDIYGEFAAVSRGSAGTVPMLSFADPGTYFDLYDPDGFVDPDHIDKVVAEKWSVKAADGFVKIVKPQTPVSEVLRRAGLSGDKPGSSEYLRTGVVVEAQAFVSSFEFRPSFFIRGFEFRSSIFN